MTARPTPEQRAEMAAYIDVTEPGLLDDLGIKRATPMSDRPVAGQPNAATLELCFWEALKRCALDDDIPINLEFRGDDDTGSGIELPNPIPPKLWEYMAAAHADLRQAAVSTPTTAPNATSTGTTPCRHCSTPLVRRHNREHGHHMTKLTRRTR